MSDPYDEALREEANRKLFAAEEEAERWKNSSAAWESIARALHEGSVMLTDLVNLARRKPAILRQLDVIEDVPPIDSFIEMAKDGGMFRAGFDGFNPLEEEPKAPLGN